MIRKLTLTILICLSFSSLSFAQSKPKTFVIIGDSLTEGYGVPKENAYPALLEKKLKEENRNWKVINSGVSGSTTASALSRVKWILKSKPDMIMIALGANDGLRGVKVATSRKNLEDALDELKKANIPVVIAGMQMPPNFGRAYSDEFKSMFASLAKKYNAKFVPFMLEGVAGDSKLNQPDGIHPNEGGHKIMAEYMYKQLKDTLK